MRKLIKIKTPIIERLENGKSLMTLRQKIMYVTIERDNILAKTYPRSKNLGKIEKVKGKNEMAKRLMVNHQKIV